MINLIQVFIILVLQGFVVYLFANKKSMKKPIFIVALCCLMSFNASIGLAQQDQLFMVYPFMPLAINPAYAGAKEVINFTGVYRKRPLFNTLGVASTNQQYFTFDMPLAQEKIGIGFQAYNTDQSLGQNGLLLGNLGLYGDVAYRIPMPNDGKLAVGLQLGITQVPAILIGSNDNKRFWTNLGLGLYYKNDDWFAGLSLPNINASEGYSNPMFLTAGHWFALNNNFTLKTGLLLRHTVQNVQPTALDINTTLWIKEQFGIGFWYQNTGSEFNTKALLGSLEVQLSKMRIGYSYDFQGANTQTNSPIDQGFHQIMLRFDFDAGNGKSAVFQY